MRLKHILYALTLVCALAEIGMALYAMHWGDIIQQMAWNEQGNPNSELLVVKSLNIALPLGLICMWLLVWIWKMDAIGGFALFMAVVLHMIGVDLNVRAVKKVYGAGTPLASVTWWAPSQETLRDFSVLDGTSS